MRNRIAFIGLAAAALAASAEAPGLAITIGVDPAREETPPPPAPPKLNGPRPVPGGGTKERRKRIFRDVRAWIAMIHRDDCAPSESDVRTYLSQHWAEAGDLHADVIAAVL